MKKIVAFVMIVATLLMCMASFLSCSKQIEQGSYRYAECDTKWVDEISGSQKKKLAEYYGYESKQDYTNDKAQKISEVFLGSSFNFEDNGTGEIKIKNETGSFTWKQDGKKIDITFENKEFATIFENTDFEISSGDFVAKVHDIENAYAITVFLIYKQK